ncbi:MAG TPA: TlpA disulfide reductase family protein [Gemmatimonadaceae bacterium]|jgi:thiol-disulfide isomerase/thioredoxin|nr:TlpA disulfide reductase family protein [Gemmatimonadaceae bacterium]
MRVLIVLLTVLLAAPAAYAQSALPGGIAVGRPAPDAAVQTLDGKPASLKAYIGTTPVVMEFWAKWCSNCRELAPALRAAETKYAGRVKFLTIAVSADQTPAEVAQFAATNGLPHPIVYDTGAATTAYDVPGTSFLVVVDRHGTIVYTGAGGAQDVDAAIRKAL